MSLSRPSALAALRVTPASASSGVRRNSVQAMLIVSRIEVRGEVPGLAVGRDRHRHVGLAEQIDRRSLGLAQSVERAGQQGRDGPGLRHRRDIGRVGIFDMVGGERAELRRQRGAVGGWRAVRRAA